VVVKVPEISIAKIRTGMEVDLTLDAYGKNEIFKGVIAAINPAETIVDGVPVYETKIVFSKRDDRIRSGMTATAKIVAEEKKGVVAIPASIIQSDADGSYVYVVTGEKITERRAVTTGLRGSDSMVEIVSGLTAGEQVSPEAMK
jgi:HlyD family secretion protein